MISSDDVCSVKGGNMSESGKVCLNEEEDDEKSEGVKVGCR